MPERAGTETAAESLGLYAATLRRGWALGLAVVVVAALAGYTVATELPKSYEATAKVLLDRQKQVDALLGTSDFSPDPERELNTDVELITLEPIADAVRRSLGLRDSAAALVGRAATAVDRNSSIVSISVRDDRPDHAAQIANAFASAYRDYRARTARTGVEDAIASARARLRRLPLGPQRSALRVELRRLQVAGAFQTGGVQIVHRASASAAAATSHPRPLVSAFIGGFLGLIVAALLIVLLARTDKQVRSDRDLEAATGRPVVAHVPAGPSTQGALVDLAMSLSRSRADEAPPGLVLLTSPGPGEGTADVALGLASGLAALGRQVIVIEADLRHPSFARRLGLGSAGGLAAILCGEDELDRQLARVEESVAIVPAGGMCALPQPLLAGPRMAALVEEACGRADVILLAGAPVGVVGDSLALVGLADAVLLVARLGGTRLDELQRAMRALAEAEASPLGIVSTTRPPRRGLGGLRRALKRRRSGAVGAAQTTSEATVG